MQRWVIGDLARFRRAISGVGHDWQPSGVRGPNFTKLGEDTGLSFRATGNSRFENAKFPPAKEKIPVR